MKTGLRQAAFAWLIASSSFAIPRAALADVTACVRAHTSGQREAKAGHLQAASRSFASCVSQNGCPDAIRSECADFYKATQSSLPTVVFAALDERGGDLIEVRVFADDRLLAESLDGRPIALDPGQHHIKFELPSGQVLESDVLVREGEKNRIVSLRAQPAAGPAAESSASQLETNGDERKLPAGFWVASGIGAAALVSFGAFALAGHSKESTLDQCSPNCSSSSHADYDAMRRDYLIADISLGVAVASAGVATWLFFRSDRSNTEQHAALTPWSSVTVTPLVSPRGGGLILGASAF
ncbi:MAG TPA: hypothetical protein VFK05_09650 [Polyangiaceae bacterium]|nr:hypothetical protein [Polyangiaceae bacterium]